MRTSQTYTQLHDLPVGKQRQLCCPSQNFRKFDLSKKYRQPGKLSQKIFALKPSFKAYSNF